MQNQNVGICRVWSFRVSSEWDEAARDLLLYSFSCTLFIQFSFKIKVIGRLIRWIKDFYSLILHGQTCICHKQTKTMWSDKIRIVCVVYKRLAMTNAFQPLLSWQIFSSQSHMPAFCCSPINESPVSYYWLPPCFVSRETALCAKNKFVFTLLVNENTTTARTTKLGSYFL